MLFNQINRSSLKNIQYYNSVNLIELATSQTIFPNSSIMNPNSQSITIPNSQTKIQDIQRKIGPKLSVRNYDESDLKKINSYDSDLSLDSELDHEIDIPFIKTNNFLQIKPNIQQLKSTMPFKSSNNKWFDIVNFQIMNTKAEKQRQNVKYSCQNNQYCSLKYLSEIVSELKFQRETYQQTMLLVDTYLSKYTIKEKKEHQMILICVLFIQQKFNEVTPISLNQIERELNISAEEVVDMEQNILKMLKFECFFVTPCFYLKFLLDHWDSNVDQQRNWLVDMTQDTVNFIMIMELLDCVYMDNRCYEYSYLDVCASIIFLYIGWQSGELDLQVICSLRYNNKFANKWPDQYQSFFRAFLSSIPFSIQMNSRLYVSEFFKIFTLKTKLQSIQNQQIGQMTRNQNIDQFMLEYITK